MCRVLKVSASGYYAWQRRPDSLRACENRRLLAAIRTIHVKSRGTYGSLRVRAELHDQGHHCGRHRVVRLMQTAGLQGIPKRRFRRTTTSGHKLPVAPNRLNQDFSATAPNQRWVADITYVRTGEGWLYLAVILDLYSRKVVGLEYECSVATPPGAGSPYDGSGATYAFFRPHSSHRSRQPICQL